MAKDRKIYRFIILKCLQIMICIPFVYLWIKNPLEKEYRAL
jgi:hypothetical protein